MHDQGSFEFGPFRLEPAERRLSRGGEPVALSPKAFDLLVFLAANPNRLLRKEELMERLWPGTFVEEVNLAQNVSAIRKALGGDREAYIQTVAGTGYRFVGDVAAADRPRGARLLVLPFRMLKPDPDLDFLAYSLPDALSVALSAIQSLTVRSSLVAARFASDTPDLPHIAKAAHVDYVVSGTVLRAGSQVRVTAQLADAAAGTLLWSHTSQSPVDDLFRLQDSLVERIADSLARPLTAPDQQRLRHDVPASAKAYEFFLRGNEASRTLNASSVDRAETARDLYLQSVADDPRYAPAWARLARVYRLLGKYRAEDGGANLARADEALQRALALNPDLSAAHNLFAQIEVDRGRAEPAMLRLLERLRRHGADAEVCAGLVQACRFCGLLDESIAAHQLAHRLDPTIGTSVMHTYFVMRRFEDVVAVSGPVKGYVWALSLDALGRGAEALSQLTSNWSIFKVARLHINGTREDTIASLKDALKDFGDPEAFYYAARHFAHLGEARAAIDALAISIRDGYTCAGGLATDPWFDSIRKEPEFNRLAALARERFESAAAAFSAAGGPRLLRP
jgi:DNA-binding winged helix-turn-helix (wHTH) protein/tetratricopeptide (TPR) repeat protein